MNTARAYTMSGAAWALVLALAGCANTTPYGDPRPHGAPLDGERIKAKLEGNSVAVQGYRAYHGPITVYFPAYGDMRGLRSNNYRDAGSWRVTDNGVCLTWENWWSNVERCWTVYPHSRGLMWIAEDGELADVSAVSPGNVAGI